MLLTIDVGNTNTVLGMFDGDQIVEHWPTNTDPDRTADEIAVLLRGLLEHSALVKDADVSGIALCSTVPSVLHEMREMVPPVLRGNPGPDRRAGRAHRGVRPDGQPQGSRQRPDHEHGGRGAPG